MAKHKADGLYYVTPAMLESQKNMACSAARRAVYEHARVRYSDNGWEVVAIASKRDVKIPVTLDLMSAINRVTSPRTWLWSYAFAYKVPEAVRFESTTRARPSSGPTGCMDLLLLRAEHEGLIQKETK